MDMDQGLRHEISQYMVTDWMYFKAFISLKSSQKPVTKEI
jgi:hypothetical protein